MMNELELFPRTDTVKPFLLLDRHGCRLEMPFWHYKNNPKDHWVVCFGVHYDTALRQVRDYKAQNSSLNSSINIAKEMECWKEMTNWVLLMESQILI